VYHDSDFYRQRHKDRVAEMRRDYQRAQAWPKVKPSMRIVRYVQSMRSHMRWHSARRAPVYRP
jgi:hypothetical protein